MKPHKKKAIAVSVLMTLSLVSQNSIYAQDSISKEVPTHVPSEKATTEAKPIVTEDIEIKLEKTQEIDKDILFIQEGNVDEEEEAQKEIVRKEAINSFSLAIQSKKYDEIESHLKNGANINLNLYDGNNIAILSSFHGDSKLLNFAAEKKADLTKLNDKGESIIYWGSTKKDLEYLSTVKTLLSPKDFDVLLKKQTKTKRNPLHAAVLYGGNLDVIKFLLGNKVSLKDKDENGQTPLHYAAALRKWNVLEFLLKNGGNINEVDAKNESVEQYLIEKWDLEAMQKLYSFVSPTTQRIIESRLSVMGPFMIEEIVKLNPNFKRPSPEEQSFIMKNF